jgi:protein SCO1/2
MSGPLVRTALSTVIVLSLGIGALWAGTDGFLALTTEQARRLAVSRAPRPLPPVTLEDQDGRSFGLTEYHGKKLLVNFIYTRCRTICGVLTADFQRLTRLTRAASSSGAELLSISFDPDADTTVVLKAYADRYLVDGKVWRFARIEDRAALGELLRAFEVVVIRDPFGDFQHNAAIYLLNENGRLVQIFGYDQLEQAAEAAMPVR